MDLGGIQLRGAVVRAQTDSYSFLNLSDQIIGIVGPNGVGKTRLMNAIKRSLHGIESNLSEPLEVSLEIVLPMNIKEFVINSNLGILKSIPSLLAHKASNLDLIADEDITTESMNELLLGIWQDSVTFAYKDWAYLGSEKQWGVKTKFDADQLDAFMKNRLERYKEWYSIIGDKEANNDLKLRCIEEKERIETSIINSFQPLENGYIFLITPAGTASSPKWRVKAIFKAFLEDLTTQNSLAEFVQLLVWPKTIAEASKTSSIYCGNFSRGFDSESIQISAEGLSVQFLNDEVRFHLDLGTTETSLGFNFVDPDDLDIAELKVEFMQFLEFHRDDKDSDLRRLIYRVIEGVGKTKSFRYLEDYSFELLNSSGDFTDKFLEHLSEFSQSLTEGCNAMLPGFPKIEATPNPKNLWLSKGLVSLEARDGDQRTSLEELSATQQRWIKLALVLFMYQFESVVIFVDEPERGMQKRIEMKGIEFFKGANENPFPIFLATHSAEVISLCDTCILIKKVDKGNREMRTIAGSLIPHLESMALTQEDWFSTHRLLVLTEGKFDEAMLRGFAQQDFEKNRIEILSGFGIDTWTTFWTSEILRKSNHVRIVFVADSLSNSKLRQLLDRVKREKIEDSKINWFLLKELSSVFEDKMAPESIQIISGILSKDLISKSNRVKILSTGDYDCIEWLPPNILGIKSGKTWEEIEKEALSSKFLNPGLSKGKRFKSYVRRLLKDEGIENGLDLQRLQNICADLAITDQVPSKVKSLLKEILEFSKSK